jgi:nucleoside-triphosphatase THEP1
MKILLTGPPKSGKTTLLANLLDAVPSKRGLVAKEIRVQGERIGFDLVDNTSRTAPLSRIGKPTPYPVSRYFVDVEALDNFIEPLFSFEPHQLLYIDEIGQMQLYSSRFKELLNAYLDASNDFLGTITSVYQNEFVEGIRSRKDILLCVITPDNRTELEQGLTFALRHRDMIAALPSAAQQTIIEMGAHYLHGNSYTSFKKLFKNALPYIAQGKIEREAGGFLVEGNTNNHHVKIADNGVMACDCDFFNGRGQFKGKEGECSHIQTAMLLNSAETE